MGFLESVTKYLLLYSNSNTLADTSVFFHSESTLHSFYIRTEELLLKVAWQMDCFSESTEGEDKARSDWPIKSGKDKHTLWDC